MQVWTARTSTSQSGHGGWTCGYRFGDHVFSGPSVERTCLCQLEVARLSVRHRPKFHEAHVLKMKDIICSDRVVHLADHASTHLVVFCPKFCFQSCHRVWSDEKVFKPMSMSIPAAKLFLCSHVSSDILRKYPWGFNLDAKLPAGQIFLKRKSLSSQVVQSSVTTVLLWGLSLEQLPFALTRW